MNRSQVVLLLLVLSLPSFALGIDEGQQLLPNDPAEFDFFGNSVAVDGDRMVVGAPFNNDQGTRSGSAYVFKFEDGIWIQESKLLGDDVAGGDQFGEQVAISGDTALISARRPVSGDGNSPGAAYVFRLQDERWVQEAKLVSENAQDQDRLGSAVAIQGDLAIVGASNDDGGLGSAFVFSRSEGQWSQVQKLTASTRNLGSFFGESLSIFGDTIAVGASGDVAGGSSLAGAVYVYIFDGENWTQEDQVVAGDTIDAIRFGTAVSLDGNCLAIGAPTHSKTLDLRGAVYLFERIAGDWKRQDIIVPKQSNRSDFVGRSVALSEGTLLIGAPTVTIIDPPEPGSIYLYQVIGNDLVFQERIFATDSHDGDGFGASVALQNDQIIVGAIGNDTHGVAAGSAYSYEVANCPTVLGDVNLDGVVDLLDVAPFVDRLTQGVFQSEADVNQDGVVDLLDVQPFVRLLKGG